MTILRLLHESGAFLLPKLIFSAKPKVATACISETSNRQKTAFRVSEKHTPFPNLCHTCLVTAITRLQLKETTGLLTTGLRDREPAYGCVPQGRGSAENAEDLSGRLRRTGISILILVRVVRVVRGLNVFSDSTLCSLFPRGLVVSQLCPAPRHPHAHPHPHPRFCLSPCRGSKPRPAVSALAKPRFGLSQFLLCVFIRLSLT